MNHQARFAVAVAERFAADTATHELTVVHDDDLYRHLRFKRPNTGMYWFDLVTWPGHLAFVGDGDGFVFARIPDMFQFFRGPVAGYMNPQYWSEKLVAPAGQRGVQKYSEEQMREYLADVIKDHDEEYPGLGEAIQDKLLDESECDLTYEDSARQALRDFNFKAADGPLFEFDVWEMDFSDWDWWFLWACHGIAWGIARYDEARAASNPGEVA